MHRYYSYIFKNTGAHGMKYARASISLPEPLLKVAKKSARRKMRNFSSYVAELIDRDAKALDGEQKVAPAK